MNREFRRVPTGEMLAYVDGCLPPGERAAFKATMLENPEINSQIDIWLFQNEAIRAAFPVPFHGAASVADGESAARRFALEFPSPGSRTARDNGELDRRPHALARAGVRAAQPEPIAPAPAGLAGTSRRAPAFARRMLSVFIGVLVFWAAGAFLFGNPSAEFARAATAAYRAFADNATRPVEVATSDRETLHKWFAPQILRPLEIPDLAAAGLLLVGGRVAPGAFSSAQYVLFENPRHERIALEIEAVDAPPETNPEIRQIGALLCASWTGAGHNFALVGRVSRTQLAELAHLIRQKQAAN